MSTIDEIKSKIDIVDLVSEAGVKLRHAGKNYTGFCPFHDNKHSPAFVVWPETGTWRCFGQCNEGGDIFKFVMKREGLDFKEALQKLAARAGVELKEYQRETPQQKEAYENLRKLLEDAIIYYRSHLFANKNILDYLHEKRGLNDSTIETFGLGYAPAGYDNLLNHFTQRGYSEQDLIDSGLLSVRESESQISSLQSRSFDRFRNRIMIPIRDEQGRMAGFGARIVDPNDIPKFLNSPETPIFSKGRLLYGLDRARKPIRTADQAVIVEGYLDVIALHQAGYENVVSPMGTALTEDQMRLLKKFTRRIVLALDPDTAGQKAVLRGLDAARSAMDKEGELGFDARGLLRNESRLQADLRVATMPDDLDPDEIVARDKDEWKKLIEDAKPIVTHVMETLAAGQNINDPKVKNRIAAQVLPLIEDLPNALERDTYRQALARMLRVDERSLLATQAQGGVLSGSKYPRVRRPRQVEKTEVRESTSPVTVSVSSSKAVEEYVIGVLFRKPELLYRLDRSLQEFGLIALTAKDFDYTDNQMLFRLIRESVEQDKTEHHDFVVDSLPETLQARSQELVKEAEKLDRVEEKLLEELLRGVIKLRRVAAGENINQLRFLQEEAHESGDARASSYQDLVLQHTRLLRDLDQAHRKMAVKRLE
ncbi:MAG TPA: DNA primase [Anaerolineales bacterium]|nr:DNA primase [Anaerolineales bacterium]HNQ94247.1 DNA primase [Anaerolineales bacterium]HNS60609.1 DNA primase [Anaerolineales bacterium]